MKKCASLRNYLLLFGITLLLLPGCATPKVPLNYAPSSASAATGSVSVTTFKYLPAEIGKVESCQVRNTALGNIKFDQDVNQYFRDAVFKELRFVGIKVDDKTRLLSGEIEDFLIDDLGHNVDWTLTVKYFIKDAQNGSVLYESAKTIQRRTAKFANFYGSLNEIIKLNVEELIKDEAFIKTIN